jgi:hypothetical protein
MVRSVFHPPEYPILIRKGKTMRKITIVLMILGLALLTVPMAQARTTLNFTSVENAAININATDVPGGIGTFFFTEPNGDFIITLASGGTGDAIGDTGIITNPASGFVITGPIQTDTPGGAQYSAVTGVGGVDITDHNGDHFTADLQLHKIETNVAGTFVYLNDLLLLSLTNIHYTGTETDLQNIGRAMYLSFQTDAMGQNLTFLTSGDDVTLISAYSGKFTPVVPVPPSALLLGSGLLGLVAVRFRRHRA